MLNNGTAVGEVMELTLRTIDGGQNWITQTSGTLVEYTNGVSFTDTNNGTVGRWNEQS